MIPFANAVITWNLSTITINTCWPHSVLKSTDLLKNLVWGYKLQDLSVFSFMSLSSGFCSYIHPDCYTNSCQQAWIEPAHQKQSCFLPAEGTPAGDTAAGAATLFEHLCPHREEKNSLSGLIISCSQSLSNSITPVVTQHSQPRSSNLCGHADKARVLINQLIINPFFFPWMMLFRTF